MMPSNTERLACITLDLEEDHAGLTSQPPAYEGLKQLPDVVQRLKTLGVPLTVFVSSNLLERQAAEVERFPDLEFQSHGYYHPSVKDARNDAIRIQNIKQGVKVFRNFFNRLPQGYRAPYGIYKDDDLKVLRDEGVEYDSSLFAGWHLSGLRPWLSSRPEQDRASGLTEFPISALYGLRVPYNLSFMRLIGDTPYRFFANLGQLPNPLIFDFHLHDLVHTSTADHLSPFFKAIYGRADYTRDWAMLESWIRLLQQKGLKFVTMSELIQRRSMR